MLDGLKRKYRSQLLPAFWFYRRLFPCNPVFTWVSKERLLKSEGLGADSDRELLRNTSSTIFCQDRMYSKGGSHYYKVGLSAIRCIDEVLKCAPGISVSNVLDFPCGHGRVLRFLVQRFPNSHVVCSDIDETAVRFCRSHFTVDGENSVANLDELSLGRQFDLIWCGSLLTHFDSADAQRLLRFFDRHLEIGGIVVFTGHGDRAADRVTNRTQEYYPSLRLHTPEERAAMVASFLDDGYGYLEYRFGETGFGFSLTSPHWIREQIGTMKTLKEVFFVEHFWDDHHDVYGLVKQP